jgi:chaperonin cofactor prefoldin
MDVAAVVQAVQSLGESVNVAKEKADAMEVAKAAFELAMAEYQSAQQAVDELRHQVNASIGDLLPKSRAVVR